MSGFRPFLRGAGRGPSFVGYDEFVPEHLPDPGAALEDHDVLVGREHAAFHRLSRALFEERGVYDVTFGYNLARLNLDVRHPDAGYRYAVERAPARDLPGGDRDRVLRAEFTPTTPFCPQSDTLTKGSFRAWNGLRDRHEFDLVRVRVADGHQRAAEINAELRAMEAEFVETGIVGDTDTRERGDLDAVDTPGDPAFGYGADPPS